MSLSNIHQDRIAYRIAETYNLRPWGDLKYERFWIENDLLVFLIAATDRNSRIYVKIHQDDLDLS